MTPDFHDRTASRRRVLRASGATLVTGITALGAGCNGLPPLGTQIKYGSVDVPQADPPSYREWFPAPSALPKASGASDGYSAVVHAPPPEDAPAWAGTSYARRVVVSATDYVGVDVDDADVAVSFEHGDEAVTALVGDVDPAAVEETVPNTAYERLGAHAGYDLYRRTDRSRVVAAGPDGVVVGNGPHARALVTATVDAGRGEIPRYHEREANVAALTANAGRRRWGTFWLRGIRSITGGGMLEDTVSWAGCLDHEGEDVYTVETWLFPEGYDVSEPKVKKALKGGYPTLGLPDRRNASAVDVAVDGRVATIEMAIERAYVDEELSRETYQFPQVAWRVTEDPDAEQVTVHHDAGDPVPADALRVRGDDLDVSAAEAGDFGDQMEPEASFTVPTPERPTETGKAADVTVRLEVESPNGNVTTTVYEHDLA